MASAEVQAMMQAFATQMQNFTQQLLQQQQSALETLLTNDRTARQTHTKIDDKFFRKMDAFNGAQNWKDWAFQFKASANESRGL